MTNEPKITKKAAKAAAVEAAKQMAYLKKVRALIGYVAERVDVTAAVEAYKANKDATLYAAEIVAREPVGAAVWPQKVEAVKAAHDYCLEVIAKNLAKLEAVEWDANKLAPYPKYVSKYGRETTHEIYRAYEAAQAKHSSAHTFVSPVSSSDEQQKYNDSAPRLPCMVTRDEVKVQRFISDSEEATADLYNMFVCKLVKKIGAEAVSAKLEGNHVWSYSILTVTLKDGTVQRWKTQQITNCSVLGKYFPQWPTRLMKG
jgi:flagellar basal body rod protein FlgC